VVSSFFMVVRDVLVVFYSSWGRSVSSVASTLVASPGGFAVFGALSVVSFFHPSAKFILETSRRRDSNRSG